MWMDISFAVSCIILSTILASLAFFARRSSRALRKKDVKIIEQFELHHHTLLDLKSRRNLMQDKYKKLAMSNPRYVEVRNKVNTYLSENDTFENMKEYVNSIIKNTLTNKVSICPVTKKCKENLHAEMRTMKSHFSECSEDPLLIQAIWMEFRERTMMNPFSLIGSRVFHILSKTWQETKIEEETLSCISDSWVARQLEKMHQMTGLCLACDRNYIRSGLGECIVWFGLVFMTICDQLVSGCGTIPVTSKYLFSLSP